jgi:hypothetical protein
MHESPTNGKVNLGGGGGLGNFQSQWSHDNGDADPLVRRAIANGDIDEIMRALATSRLFIALVAEVAGEPSEGDKNSDMSVACLTATDGRLGLLCFTGLDSLTAWNARARPVPITAFDAAEAALDENAQAIIVDLAAASTATLTLADIVKLSGKDQRGRAVLLLREFLADMGESVTFEQRPDAVLQVEVPESLLGIVQEFIVNNAVLHSFAPEGIAISLQG